MTRHGVATHDCASADDVPIPYLDRLRTYYQGLGYGAPYRRAHPVDAPLQPLREPLQASPVTLVTMAAPFRADRGDEGPGAPYNARAKFHEVYSGTTAHDHDVRIAHVAIDRQHTTATEPGTWFPLPALRNAVLRGRIGALAARFHGAPTHPSQRTTLAVDGPEIVRRCHEDGADAAVLVPNCPVCHQTTGLVARGGPR